MSVAETQIDWEDVLCGQADGDAFLFFPVAVVFLRLTPEEAEGLGARLIRAGREARVQRLDHVPPCQTNVDILVAEAG